MNPINHLFNGNRSGLAKWVAVPLLVAGYLCVSGAAFEQNVEVKADGERLVRLLDCHACHTPKVFTPNGPQLDTSRLLSGHRADEKLPPIPEKMIGADGWGGVFNNSLTAWAGPWGVSFASNLTPDAETGIGNWSEQIFADAMRTGMHVGETRPFLPPMPTYAALTDEEVHAIFSYLQSIQPVENVVPPAEPPRRSNAGEPGTVGADRLFLSDSKFLHKNANNP